MTGRALQGKVNHEFGAGGVSWTLDVPAAAVVMQSRSDLITMVPEVSSALVARGHVSAWRRHLRGLREGVVRQNPETDRRAKVGPVHVLMSLPEGHARALSA